MDTIKTVPTRFKNFVIRHKVGAAVIGTSIVWITINRSALREHDAFLSEKGLLDEYYSPEE